ncbi:MAG: HAD-IC family P-type ATPase, partial [Caldilineaceae bacterium]|nr:HAD-IC family P-type ATPase [Caldilineaceae bacterium]
PACAFEHQSFPIDDLAHCHACDDVLALASAVERRSEHPLARAILSASETSGSQAAYPTATGVTALSGLGVVGTVNGRAVIVGSHAHFDAHIQHSPEQCALADGDERQGLTPIMVGADGRYIGSIVVSDTVRSTAAESIAQLTSAGIRNIAMLTGDGSAAAQLIADQVGVTDVRANLLPADKLTTVQNLRAEYGPVAMVGDGINDAPALASADVGISMSAATGGSALAMEAGDITLMSDDLRRLPFAYRLSRAAMRTIRANVAFSIAIKLLFFVVVLLGAGSMWLAVLADVGASLLVTLNGMRLLRWKGTA